MKNGMLRSPLTADVPPLVDKYMSLRLVKPEGGEFTMFVSCTVTALVAPAIGMMTPAGGFVIVGPPLMLYVWVEFGKSLKNRGMSDSPLAGFGGTGGTG